MPPARRDTSCAFVRRLLPRRRDSGKAHRSSAALLNMKRGKPLVVISNTYRISFALDNLARGSNSLVKKLQYIVHMYNQYRTNIACRPRLDRSVPPSREAVRLMDAKHNDMDGGLPAKQGIQHTPLHSTPLHVVPAQEEKEVPAGSCPSVGKVSICRHRSGEHIPPCFQPPFIHAPSVSLQK